MIVRLRAEHDDVPPIVRWEIATDRRFAAREQHGLALVERAAPHLSLRITGLSPGRAYWYRVGRHDCVDCYTIGSLEIAPFDSRAVRAASCRGPSSAHESSVHHPIRA